MMSDRRRPRLSARLREFAATAAAFLHNRVALAATEAELGLRETIARLLWTLVATLFAFLALVMLSVFVLVLAWDRHRLAAAGGLVALYATLALAAWWWAERIKRRSGRFLSGTIEALRRDIDGLRGPR